MKKIWIAIAVVAVVVVAGLGVAGYVYAQSTTPPAQDGTTTPYGGMMGSGWGGHMGMMGGYAAGETGPLHDLMITAWAEKLGLTVDELNAKIDGGLTMAEIAEAQGVTGEAFNTAWVEVHTAVWDEAVAQGLITADQAQIMKDRMQTRLDAGWVPGTAGAGCPMLDGDKDGQTGNMMGRGNRGGMMGGWKR
jgi:hypothetical protein